MMRNPKKECTYRFRKGTRRIGVLFLSFAFVFLSTGCSSSPLQRPTSHPKTTISAGQLLEEARPPRSDALIYQTPTLGQQLSLTPLIQKLIGLLDTCPSIDDGFLVDLHKVGFHPVFVENNDDKWLVLVEHKIWQGKGGYVFRCGKSNGLLIQSPHGYHDRLTAEIGFELFKQTRARAFFFNTAHRYSNSNLYAKGKDPADLAHRSDTIFYLITRVFLEREKSTVLQLHGFEKESDGFEFIMSNSTNTPTELILAFSKNLARKTGQEVGVYGRSSKSYGATSNPLGRWMRRYNLEFLHLEMSPLIREGFLKDPSALIDVIRTILPIEK